MSTVRPKSIRIFLSEGTPQGVTIATIPNWSGLVIKGRNSNLPALLEREEAKNPGVYILLGEDPEQTDTIKCYIGQASILGKRIAQHAEKKDWWEEAYLISTTDGNFAAGHFLALESKMIRLAKEAGRTKLENNQQPNENAGNLGEADIADIDNFIAELSLVLPILGTNVLRPQPAYTSSTNGNNITDSQNDLDEFILSAKGSALAHAIEVDGEFIVLEGSTALKNTGNTSNKHDHYLKKLISNGSLRDNGNCYIFTRDTAISSPSKAAAIILDRSANGRIEWKHKETGKSYGEWQLSSSSLTLEDLEL